MEKHGLHRGLELRLAALARRITALRHEMTRAKGAQKIEEFGEIEELQRRYDTLGKRLQALNREGPGFRQDVKAELEKLADDLSGTVEDFMLWADSDYEGQRPPIRGRKP
jgi:predicted  nucleic acid-binding Zn-ribbon protein